MAPFHLICYHIIILFFLQKSILKCLITKILLVSHILWWKCQVLHCSRWEVTEIIFFFICLNKNMFWVRLVEALFMSTHNIWCTTHEKGPYAICWQCRPRSACAFVQADLGLRCLLIESMDTVVYIYEHSMHRCACWSVPSFVVYDTRAIFHRSALYVFVEKWENINIFAKNLAYLELWLWSRHITKAC